MTTSNLPKNYLAVIKRPRITEKATMLGESNVYTLNVAPEATKQDVEKAVALVYKVKPVKVRMITIPAKNVFRRGKAGVKSGGKKALVYLKEGDKIEFV